MDYHLGSGMLLDEIRDSIDAADYPLTTEELVEHCGDEEIELQMGTEAVCEALGRAGEETYETAEEARFAVLSGLSEKAVGRTGYSDRDPVSPDGPYALDQVSF